MTVTSNRKITGPVNKEVTETLELGGMNWLLELGGVGAIFIKEKP